MDDVGTGSGNAGLNTPLGFTETLGAAENLVPLSVIFGGEAGGLKVTTGGPGLLLSVDLKTNSVLY